MIDTAIKIYDCFTFFNELDILEIRLNILNDDVDFFVLVESTKTHSGNNKELFFEKNKSRFQKFSHKIIHIIVDDMPEVKGGNRWLLENFQRNAITRGLSQCKDTDLILISDLDEIPNIKKLAEIKRILLEKTESNDLLYTVTLMLRNILLRYESKVAQKIIALLPVRSNKIIIFQQKIYCYFLNGYADIIWYGSKAVLYKNLVHNFNLQPQKIRDVISRYIIKDGGWHFSYQFDPEGIANKLKSFAHREYDKAEYTDLNLIRTRIEKGEFLFGKKVNLVYQKIDNSYPQYILDNLDKYKIHIKQI